MMLRFKKKQGFSLIELMVVMAIMALLLALTGGLVVKNVDQQKRLVERQKVHQLFKSLSYQAYYRGQPITVRAEGKTLYILQNNNQSTIEFEQLLFKRESYRITTTAVVIPGDILLDSDRGNITLTPLFKTFKANEMQ